MITDREQIKRTLSEKELFVFDMDGTIYLGENVFRPAVDFIKNCVKTGKRCSSLRTMHREHPNSI